MTAALLAVVATAGLAAVMISGDRRVQLGGLVVLAGGVAGLAAWLERSGSVGTQVSRHPALAGAGGLVALAGGAVVAWLLLRRPWLLAFLALAAAPVRLALHVGGQNANLLLPLYAVIGAAWLALVVRVVRGESLELPPRQLALPVSLYTGFYALSLAWSADVRRGAITTLFFLLPFGLLAVALVQLPLRLDMLRRLLVMDVAMAVGFALVGLAQWLDKRIFWNASLEVSNAYSRPFRVNSLFYDPSVYGRFLAIAIALLVTVILLERVSRPGWVALLIVPIWLGLLVSFSQSSFVALSAGVLAAAGLAWPRRALAWLAAGTLAVVLVGLALPPLHSFRNALLHGHVGRVTSTRSTLVSRGLRLFVHNPLWGVGGGGFTQAALPRHNAEARTAKGASHTTPLTVAAELGVIGLAAYVWLLVGLGRLALRPPPRAPPAARVARYACAVGLVVLLVHSLAYASFFEDPMTWGFAALLAVCARSQAGDSPAAPADPATLAGVA